MSHDNDESRAGLVPFSLDQNPAPGPSLEGQDYQDKKQALVNQIMATFRKLLPSNYVAETNGPWYSLQFQAMAEQLADIQLEVSEIYKDSDWDFTRTDFLWSVLGQMVFPGATDRSGIPDISSDLAYRDFLHQMVVQLLKGATTESMEGGVDALGDDFISTVLERYLASPPRDPNGAYTIKDQFTVDIFIETESGGFPGDPTVTERNARLVLSALKPAHVIYTYSHLFRDAFDQIADDAGGPESWEIEDYRYDDMRKWCHGFKGITGTGETLSNRTLFSDPSLSFVSITKNAVLRVLSGPNAGAYRVVGTRALLSGATATPASYTVSSGGSGTLVALEDDVVEDTSRDWGALAVDTTITILDGVNAGTYRLHAVLGSTGGLVGKPGVSGDQVRLSPSILQVERRMPSTAVGQSYEVEVDRLGHKSPKTVSAEDVSAQFYL